MSNYKNYTDVDLKEAVRSSSSRRQVLIKLGLAPKGGNYDTIKRAIARLDVNTDHFLPSAGHNRGKRVGPLRPIEDYFSGKARIRSSRLREKLISEDIFEHQCSWCKGRTWLGKEIPLELDHIDGDNENNNLENLRLLCPNCHAQTPTYRGRNRNSS